MFRDLVESSVQRGSRSKSSLFVSCGVHGVFILILLLVPLLYYETLPAQVLVLGKPPTSPAPPQPPPPPTAAQLELEKTTQVEVRLPDLVAPTQIPPDIPPPEVGEIPDVSTLTMRGAGSLGGVPGGTVGTVGSWLPFEAVDSAPPTPPPPPAARKEPVLKGGEVMASKLIRRIAPAYPELAKRARVQGPVHLQLRIDELGSVVEIQIISGHPLLVEAAVDAVSQWKYSPTLLNGEPVPVIATVTVNFVLN